MDNDDLPSTLSRDFASRTLRGDVPRWHNLESLVHVLVEHQLVGESDVKEALWVLADASPQPSRTSKPSRTREPETDELLWELRCSAAGPISKSADRQARRLGWPPRASRIRFQRLS